MATGRPNGRPSIFSEALADEICSRLSNGESLRRICLTPKMPAAGTVCRWLTENERFREQYKLAREAQAETLADEIIDIADGKRGEYENGQADVQRDRLAVDARKWVASKLKPKVYGEKTLLGSDPENPLPAPTGLDVSKLSTAALKEIVAARDATDSK